ncbi:hypothetical protein F5051DRAFT_430107 [Lentinula edodes]|nr:hypothetical protein F5051DRAFT_430107 [Lentinula edodes]
MTATPPASRELKYMFAHIEGDKPVQNCDLKSIVPETSIMYAPSTTLWDCVAECPPVAYHAGYWHIWQPGPAPVPVPSNDSLNKERDKLTDLRVKNIFQRPQKTPSKGAIASTFIPIAIGRPKQDEFYHVPISLFHAEFAQFKEDIVSGALEQELSPLAYRLLLKTTRSEGPNFMTHELLSDLLDDYKLAKKIIGSFETDGGIDPNDLDLPDRIHPRLILSNDNYKGDWRKTRILSVLIIHNGPDVQALGAVYLTDQYVEVLSRSLPLYFSEYDTRSMENLLRFITALRNLFRSLLKVDEKSNDYAIDSDQFSFPYPRSYRSSGTTFQFTYIKRVSRIRLVFTARTEGDQDIIVKFR